MPVSLDKDIRNQLARTTLEARNVAETAARAALENLAIHEREYRAHMSSEQRSLRNRLRARGRAVGDVRDGTSNIQEIRRLTELIAYENWHRLLFTRFLTENNLLITDATNGNVPVTLAECEELASELGAKDGFDLACRFASEILPGVFRKDDPALEVPLAINDRVELESLLNSIPRGVFVANDSLGWTYQYWQAQKKDEVNASGNKIGADELPAVTQLFTENYMVEFLYHNTIGAWHAGKVMAENPNLATSVQSEEELRQAVRLRSHGGYDFEYLRFVREPREGDEDETPTGPWRPAAGTFEGWPKTVKELKILDPCCGSGHFLVEGFELLVRLRMDEMGLDLEEAIRVVLADNLYGLELDPRCTQIAAFNIALAAWKLTGRPIELPPLHIARSGMGVGSTKTEWTKLAGDDRRLQFGMERLYELFKQAPELGSLIDPVAPTLPMLEADFAELQPLLEQALVSESGSVDDAERAATAQGMAKAAELLAGEYTLAITNVPYLGRRHHTDIIRGFADTFYDVSKSDLATMFLDRMMKWLSVDGTAAVVTPQNWLFLKSYKNLRQKLLNQCTWNVVARLGSGAFETISGEVVNVALSLISNAEPIGNVSMAGTDASSASSPATKASLLRGEITTILRPEQSSRSVRLIPQSMQIKNPDSTISLKVSNIENRLREYAVCIQGLSPSDRGRLVANYWEVQAFGCTWSLLQGSDPRSDHYVGRHQIMKLRFFRKNIREVGGAMRGKAAFSRPGVSISKIGELPVTIYSGMAFDGNAHALIPFNEELLAPIWAFCESTEFSMSIRSIDAKLDVTNANITKVPFDLEHWQNVAEEKYPNGLPEPYSDDPTQWLFHGHPAEAEEATILQVAIARLLGYQWPAELDPNMRLARRPVIG